MSARRQIIAALSEDRLGSIATLADVDHAEQLADAYRAEVLTEAAAFVGNDDTCDCGGCDTCVPRALASGLLDMADQRKKEEAIPAGTTATPDFFQPNRTYQRGIDEFRCHAIVPDPHSGEIRAIGLRSRNGFPWTGAAMDPDDWAYGDWTDVTKGGANA